MGSAMDLSLIANRSKPMVVYHEDAVKDRIRP